MEIPELMKLRKLLKSITHEYKLYEDRAKTTPLLDENGVQRTSVESLPIIVWLDNEHSIEEQIHPLIWDDENGLMYYFKYNSNSAMAVMAGRDKVMLPARLMVVDYGQIQRLGVIEDEEAHDKYVELLMDKTRYNAIMTDTTKLIPSEQLTPEKVANIKRIMFDFTNAKKDIIGGLPPVQTDFSQTYDWSKTGRFEY